MQDGDAISEELPVPTTTKVKRVMSEEAKAKLAIAREKANAKRKELAEARRAEKEEAVARKIDELVAIKADKTSKSVEREAKKRLEDSVRERPVVEREKPRRRKIVLEGSSSDEEIVDAKVYFVKRRRPEPAKEPPSQPSQPKEQPSQPKEPPPRPHPFGLGSRFYLL